MNPSELEAINNDLEILKEYNSGTKFVASDFDKAPMLFDFLVSLSNYHIALKGNNLDEIKKSFPKVMKSFSMLLKSNSENLKRKALKASEENDNVKENKKIQDLENQFLNI